MITVYDDTESLSRAAAQLFADEARRGVESCGSFSVVLSGGETPRRTYELLADDPFRGSIPWQDVHLFWGDERHVSHDDPRSNFGVARRTLLDHLPLREDQVHPIPFLPSPAEAAFEYERILRTHFHDRRPRFDLVLLGLGEDGHTASLFPLTPVLSERHRWVTEVRVAGQYLRRVTLTPVVLNQAAVILFLVAGRGKAAILHKVLEGSANPEEIPARLINPTEGRLLWYADREAACLLSERTLLS